MGRKKKETHTLIEPLALGEGSELKELDFHSITAGDMEEVSLPINMGGYLTLAAASSGQARAVLADMSAADMIAVIPIIDGFFASGPATGSQ